MEIILPAKKGPSRRPIVLGVILAFMLGMAATALIMRATRPAPPQAPAPAAAEPRPAEDAKDREFHAAIARLEGEIDRYYDAMALAEELGDRKRYIEVVRASAAKNLEADTLWFEWQDHKRKKGLMAEGVKQAVMEMPPLPVFTDADKFKMLSEERGMPEDVLRALKAEMEILFLDELLEKFGPASVQENPAVPDGEAS